MALVVWTEQLSVGIKEIDYQHKKLVDLINELNDAMRTGTGNDILKKNI
jgi:hemerythrin